MAAFKSSIVSSVATYAGVPSSYVTIASVAPGSTVVTTLITFPAGSSYTASQV
jgi:hypothetical protein